MGYTAISFFRFLADIQCTRHLCPGVRQNNYRFSLRQGIDLFPRRGIAPEMDHRHHPHF